jgi:hypothetical protein
MRVARSLIGLGLVLSAATCTGDSNLTYSMLGCADHLAGGARSIATQRELRFLGKVQDNTAKCRGGEKAVAGREVPWVDWSNYFGTGDSTSRNWLGFRNWRGINGSLIDLEYQRVELIRFNLFDNSGTYAKYAAPGGTALKRWDEMRLPPEHPNYREVGGAAPEQLCRGELIRGRTLTGFCNDMRNPLMGSTGMPFARNVEFETTFPEESRNETGPEPPRGPSGISHAGPPGHQP